MRRILIPFAAAVIAFAVAMPAATAGSPHFIKNAFSVSSAGSTITVSGKETGLGDEAQVHIQLSATAICVNNGGNHPQAANKTTATSDGYFPVQNGMADFSLTATAAFSPDCSRSMDVVFTDVTVTDLTNGISTSFRV